MLRLRLRENCEHGNTGRELVKQKYTKWEHTSLAYLKKIKSLMDRENEQESQTWESQKSISLPSDELCSQLGMRVSECGTVAQPLTHRGKLKSKAEDFVNLNIEVSPLPPASS